MNHKQAIELLVQNINDLELPFINTVNFLDNPEPTIYLCGKSSSGKTTFLNALFNLEKDELFTSTNISTKTEFKFKYGVDEKIEKSDGSLISLPDTSEERKLLFNSLNQEGHSYYVTLDKESLKNRTIVDIPGVFDFKRNDEFSKRMLDEADIVYFFTPCTAKINDSEYNLLQSISEAGIPIIVLFTMGDLTEVDEGITRKTIPKLVHNRLSSCFKDLEIAHYQIISSNDFYKNKDTHGIDHLQSHINGNDQQYKQVAEKQRLERVVNHYLGLIENKIEVLSTDSETFKNLVINENKLWYKSEKLDLENENDQIIKALNSELSWLLTNCDEQVFGKSYQKIYSEQNKTSSEQEENFKLNWNKFWSELISEFEFLNMGTPKLPSLPEELFEQVEIGKLKEVLDAKMKVEVDKKNVSTKDAKSKTSKPDKQKETNASVKKEEKSIEENDKNSDKQNKSSANVEKKEKSIETKIKNPPNKSGWKNLSGEDFLSLANEAGINLTTAKLIWTKWSYLKDVESTITQTKADLMTQVDFNFKSRLSGLEQKMEEQIKAGLANDPTIELKAKHIKSLNQLKTI